MTEAPLTAAPVLAEVTRPAMVPGTGASAAMVTVKVRVAVATELESPGVHGSDRNQVEDGARRLRVLRAQTVPPVGLEPTLTPF